MYESLISYEKISSMFSVESSSGAYENTKSETMRTY